MRSVGLVALFALAACSSRTGDPPAPYTANVLGAGQRLREVQDPALKLAGSNVTISTAVVAAVDNFDETHDGKSRGTVYVQDADTGGPLAAITLYSPSFQPTSLRLGPGDVVDMSGQYVEQTTIGSTVNFAPAFLPQLNKPQVTFRFEVGAPQPTVINVGDLSTFDTGRKWIGQLVTIQNVTVAGAPVSDSKKTGRVTAALTADAKNGPGISNELYDMPEASFPANTTFKSVTGLVTYFFNLKIAPRSAADLVK